MAENTSNTFVEARKLSKQVTTREGVLTLLDDMTGHPGMAHFRDKGFEIITF